MACSGNCSACPFPCAGASKLFERAKQTITGENKTPEHGNDTNNKGGIKMSEAVGGCHAGNEEKIGRLDERNNANAERGKTCLTCFVVGALVVAGSLWYINSKIDALKVEIATGITKVQTESSIKLQHLEKRMEELKSECEQAKRDYTSARVYVSRHKE